MSLLDLERSSVLQSIQIAAAPAAGAEWTFTVPAGLTYKFETIFFTLTTSAVAGNRGPRAQIKDGSGNVLWEASVAGMPASGTYRQSYGRLLASSVNTGSGNTSLISLPDIWLPAGYVIGTNTVNKDVGDQFSVVSGIVRVSTADAV